MKLLKIAALSATLLAGGCATEYAWQRADGGPLDRHFAWAAQHCRERARNRWDNDRAEAMQRCMERHGYVWTASAVSTERRHHNRHYDGGYGRGRGYDDYNDYND